MIKYLLYPILKQSLSLKIKIQKQSDEDVRDLRCEGKASQIDVALGATTIPESSPSQKVNPQHSRLTTIKSVPRTCSIGTALVERTLATKLRAFRCALYGENE